MLIRPTKALRTAPGESGKKWLAALADPAWLSATKILKEDGGSWVRRATILGRDVVVKCRPLNTFRRRIQSRLRLGHGDRHWRGARRLRRAEIRTGNPIALFRAQINTVECELLVITYLPGKTLLEHLNDIAHSRGPSVSEQHRIAESLADQVFTMIQDGLFNRDHKPSNIVIVETADTKPTPAVIDCVGIRGFSSEGAPMLASLFIEPLGCAVAPRRALVMRFLWRYWWNANFMQLESDLTPREIRADARENWRYLAGLIAAHGDPTPKVNPLR